MRKKIYDEDDVSIYIDHRDGQVLLYVHEKFQGAELTPRGYLLGDNALVFHPKKPLEAKIHHL